MQIFAFCHSSQSIRAPRPRGLSFMRKLSFFPSCFAREYERVNVHDSSSQRNDANCHGVLSTTSSSSIVSSSVVGLRYFFSMTFPLYFFTSVSFSSGTKSDFLTPQTGHCQSSGISENSVHGAILLSGSHMVGSYIYPQGTQSHFCHF